MLDDVRIKIREEKAKDEGLGRMGDYILDELLTTEDAAAKIGAADKSLAKCYDAVRDKARKSSVSGCAIIDSETVFGWIREYYGVGKTDERQKAAMPAAPAPINLLDLM